jgi:hypothetical protein
VPDESGKVLAFRPRPAPPPEPEPTKPIVRSVFLKDYGPPCNDMTVSLVRTYYADGTDRLVMMLCGPAIDNVGLFFPEDMDEPTLELMGVCLYRVLFHATAPSSSPAA